MFVIYNNVTRGSLIKFFLYLSLCSCCYFFPSFSLFLFSIHPNTYLSLVITLLLLLLQLCLLILPLWVFLRNQVGQSSKQGIQEGWSTPIHHVKWWISRFRGTCRTHAASEVEPFCAISGFRAVMSQRARYWVRWESYMGFVILSLILLLLS